MHAESVLFIRAEPESEPGPAKKIPGAGQKQTGSTTLVSGYVWGVMGGVGVEVKVWGMGVGGAKG